MKSPRRSPAHLLCSSSRNIENPGNIALPVGLKIARGKGLNIDHLASAPSSTWTQNNKVEATRPRSDLSGRIVPAENAPTHTGGHID